MNSAIFEDTTSTINSSKIMENNNSSPEKISRKRSFDNKSINALKSKKNKKSILIPEENIIFYKPNIPIPDVSQYLGSHIEILIEKKYIKYDNINVINKNIYGSDAYSSNSDPVCILFHCGLFNVQEKLKKNSQVYSLICNVSKAKKNYSSLKRNKIISKKLNNMNYSLNIFTIKPITFKCSSIPKFEQCHKIIMNKYDYVPIKRERLPPKRINETNCKLFTNNLRFNFLNELGFCYKLKNICDKSENSKFNFGSILEHNSIYFYNNSKIYELCKDSKADLTYFQNSLILEINELIDPEDKDNLFFIKNNVPLDSCFKKNIKNNFELYHLIFSDNKIILDESNNISIDNILVYKIYPNKLIINN